MKDYDDDNGDDDDDDDDDYDDDDAKVPGDEEGNETPEQLRTYFTLNDNLKPVGVRSLFDYDD